MGGSITISSRMMTMLPTSSMNIASDWFSRWRYSIMVCSASRSVAWCDSNRLTSPKCDSCRSSAMRRPKLMQFDSAADASSNDTPAWIGMSWSGLASIFVLRPKRRRMGWEFSPRGCCATSR